MIRMVSPYVGPLTIDVACVNVVVRTLALVTGHLASVSLGLNCGWSGGRTVVVVPTTGQTEAMMMFYYIHWIELGVGFAVIEWNDQAEEGEIKNNVNVVARQHPTSLTPLCLLSTL